MQIGLVLTGGSARKDVELAQRAEAAGLDAVFTVEFFNRHGYVPCAAIAQATERVKIGTGIANAFIRTPLLHASAAMTSTSSRAGASSSGWEAPPGA